MYAVVTFINDILLGGLVVKKSAYDADGRVRSSGWTHQIVQVVLPSQKVLLIKNQHWYFNVDT